MVTKVQKARKDWHTNKQKQKTVVLRLYSDELPIYLHNNMINLINTNQIVDYCFVAEIALGSFFAEKHNFSDKFFKVAQFVNVQYQQQLVNINSITIWKISFACEQN